MAVYISLQRLFFVFLAQSLQLFHNLKVSKTKAHMEKVHFKMSHLHNQPVLN